MHASACAVFGLVHLVVITPFRVLIAGEPLNWAHLVRAFVLAFRLLFYLDVLTYWAIVGMYLALHYSNLRTSLAEARLAALRAQLNPALSLQHAERDLDAGAQRRSVGGDRDDRAAERIAARRARGAHRGDCAGARDGVPRRLRRHPADPVRRSPVRREAHRAATRSTAWCRR